MEGEIGEEGRERGEMERGKGGREGGLEQIIRVTFPLLISPMKSPTLCVGPAVSPTAATCHRSHQMPAAKTHDVSRHGPTQCPVH